MKLYTKNHILLSVTITACIFILFISGFLIFFTNHNSSQNEINTEETLSQTPAPYQLSLFEDYEETEKQKAKEDAELEKERRI